MVITKDWQLNLMPVGYDMEPLIGITCSSCLWVEWWDDSEALPTLADLIDLAERHEHKEGAHG